ncbi:MAG TPA: PAS domain S-box protein, partial [Magnetococcales bacterium]|nr:PAS domain S-box protein [Magnetococcales bacterium]
MSEPIMPVENKFLQEEMGVADYAMALDLMGNLAKFQSEDVCINNVMDLFFILFRPKLVVFLPLLGLAPGEMVVRGVVSLQDKTGTIRRLYKFGGDYAWTESDDGFILSVFHMGERVGVLEIGGISLPGRKSQYINMALAVRDVLGLSIANSRIFQDLKQTQKVLQDEKLRFRAIMEAATDAIITIRKNGSISYWNSWAEKIFQYKSEEVLEGQVFLIIPDRYIEKHLSSIKNALETGKLKHVPGTVFPFYGRRKDGTEVSTEMVVFSWNEGVETNFTAIIRDTSELKCSLRNLEKSEERFRNIIEHSADSIAILTDSFQFLLVNPALCGLLGYTQDELIGRSFYDFLPENFHLHFPTNGFVNNLDFMEHSFVCKNSLQVYAESNFRSLKYRDHSHVLVTSRNITIRKLAEQKSQRLQDTREMVASLLQIALENIDINGMLHKAILLLINVPWLSQRQGAIFLVDNVRKELILTVHHGLCDGNIDYCTKVPFGHCLCGRAVVEKKVIFSAGIDEHHEIVFPGIMPHGHIVVPIVLRDEIFGIVNVYLNKGHEQNDEEEKFLLLFTATLAGLIERRLARDERLEAEQLSRTKSVFLANMSHEIRTPLNAIVGYTDLALKSELPSNIQRYFLNISAASSSLLRIINDLLDYSKIEADKLELENNIFLVHQVFDHVS